MRTINTIFVKCGGLNSLKDNKISYIDENNNLIRQIHPDAQLVEVEESRPKKYKLICPHCKGEW